MLTIAAGLAQQAYADLSFVNISDLHLFPAYDATKEKYCWSTGADADVVANFGRYGCDPPETLVRAVLDRVLVETPEPDVVFLTGDLVAHEIPFNPDGLGPATADYDELKDILAQVGRLMTEYFPNSIVLPSLGNNDVKYHY